MGVDEREYPTLCDRVGGTEVGRSAKYLDRPVHVVIISPPIQE